MRHATVRPNFVQSVAAPFVLRPRRVVRLSKRVSVPKAQLHNNSITEASAPITAPISRHTTPYPLSYGAPFLP